MTTYLGKSCSFCLPRVPFVNCRQFMYLVISLLVLRAGYGIWLYQFLIIAYLFTFQRDIDRLGSWARKWGMRFQPVKCNMMHLTRKRIKKIHASYTLEGTNLENVESIKYLGVTITSDLRWNTHVSNVCTKANRTFGLPPPCCVLEQDTLLPESTG